MRPFEFLLFMRRYFPIFMMGMFAGLFSIAFVFVLYTSAVYPLPRAEQELKWLFGSMLFASVYLCVCHFFLVWGRAVWVWGVVLLFILCLCMALPTVEFRPNSILYGLALLFPLIGLLILNSNRHREMRKILVIVRRKRQRFLGIRKVRLRRLKAEQSK